MQYLNGAYQRLEMPRAAVTPAEVLLIIRDMHKRLQKLEEKSNNEKPTVSRAKDSRGAKKEVSSD